MNIDQPNPCHHTMIEIYRVLKMEFEIKTAADYLISIFNERKEKNSRYSLRAYARSLGVSSGQLSEILSGKRPLSHKLARRISIALALTETESHRLIHLVSQQSQFLEASGLNSRQLSEDEIALMGIAQNLDAQAKLNLNIQELPTPNYAEMDQDVVIEVKKTIRNFRKKLKKVLDATEKKNLESLRTDKAI